MSSFQRTASAVAFGSLEAEFQVTPMTIFRPLVWMLAVAVSGISPAAAASDIDLSDYQWKHRLLFIFAPSTADPAYLALEKHLARATLEREDRDMILFRVFENSPSRVSDRPLRPDDGRALRRRFGIEAGRFTVVLVGKDGGVKSVAHQDADLESIFDLIDSMPMRRQEMRDKRSNG
jgi:hypothetical protein